MGKGKELEKGKKKKEIWEKGKGGKKVDEKLNKEFLDIAINQGFYTCLGKLFKWMGKGKENREKKGKQIHSGEYFWVGKYAWASGGKPSAFPPIEIYTD